MAYIPFPIVTGQTSGGGGSSVHNDLTGRSAADAHPTSAITGLDAALAAADAIPETLIDAKGDLVVGTAADTAARLAVGADGQVLTADSTQTAGVKWGAPGLPVPHRDLVDDLWLTSPMVPQNASVWVSVLSGTIGNAFSYVLPCPIWVPEACQIDALALYQGVAASHSGATGELALSGPSGQPFVGSLLFSAGAFDATVTAGARTPTFSPVSLAAGLYWAYLKLKVPSGTPSGTNPQFARLPAGYGPQAGTAPASSWGSGNGYLFGGGLTVTAAIPSSLSGVAQIWGNNSAYVWMGARVYV